MENGDGQVSGRGGVLIQSMMLDHWMQVTQAEKTQGSTKLEQNTYQLRLCDMINNKWND